MSVAKERLGQLLVLAAERRWTPLARELCDLILFWPSDYPEAMRGPILVLFETALRECDDGAKADLSARLAGHSEIPLGVINVLYLSAPAPMRREILMRNEMEGAEMRETVDADAVLDAARKGARDFASLLAATAAVPYPVAQAVLGDPTGEPLAVLCRGLRLSRATFSAIALLRGAEPMPLDVFDTVPDRAAACLVHSWRMRSNPGTFGQIAAAQ
jgi:hypothetical protein